MERDFCAELRAIIDEATHGQDGYVAGVVAAEIVARLRATDPKLLRGWLDAQAEQFVRLAIAERDRSIRGRMLRMAKATKFGEAAGEWHETGDSAGLVGWLHTPFVVDGDVHKPLGKLGHSELLFVQGTYDQRAAENKFYAAKMGQIAERVTTGVVEDHFTEQELRTMFTLFR